MNPRKIAKSTIPPPLWSLLGVARRRWVSRNDHKLSAKEVFSQIYEKRLWGGSEGDYTSGSGSRTGDVVVPYVDIVARWAEKCDGAKLRAVDLGCGDFEVGRNLYTHFGTYTAIDIVPSLIERHKANFAHEGLSFQCNDAIEDELPVGDVIFVRHVLQHLSNQQITAILPKIARFRFAIITEHHPAADKIKKKNLDKGHGGDIRLTRGSGVYLDALPFNLPFLTQEVLLDVASNPLKAADGRIVTTLYSF